MEVLKPLLNNGDGHGETSTGQPDASVPTEIQWAYLAGIIDGEGTIGIDKTTSERTLRTNRKVTPSYSMYVTVTNTSVRLMDWLEATFGGRRHVTTGTNYPCYGWKFTGPGALRILAGVRPYLRIKARQADLAEFFFNGRIGYRNLRCPPEEIARREGIVAELHALNRPGFAAAETKRRGTRSTPNE